MKQAVIYTRVSSDRQEKEGFSIPAQIELLNNYAQRKLYNVEKSFCEAETGKKAGRKAFNEMIKFVKENGINAILVEKTDRFYRNLHDYLIFENSDVEIHLVKEGQVISKNSSSHDKFIHGIKVLMAKNYIDNLSEEIRKGLYEKARQGYYPGKAPLGYKNYRDEETKKSTIVVDPEKAPFVKRLFELYANGTSVEQCRKILTEEGLRNNTRPYAKAHFWRTLHDPFYIGKFAYREVIYQGKHEPLIDIDLFNKVQKMCNSPRARTHDVQFSYTGLIKCAHCGCQLTAELKKGKYIYYHCTGKKGGKCHKKYIRQEKLDKVFLALLEQIYIPPEINVKIKEAMKQMQANKGSFEEASEGSITKQINTLRNRINKLYEDKLDGNITEEFYREKNIEWHREKDKLTTTLQGLHKASESFYEGADLLLKWCEDAPRMFMERNAEGKQQALKIIGANFSWDGENLSVEPNPVFDLIIKTGFSDMGKKSRLELAETQSEQQKTAPCEAVFVNGGG